MKRSFIAAATVAVFATTAYAAVTFNAATGTGFAGKGDVQLAFGWNNAQLQQRAGSVDFRSNSTVVTERSWTCTHPTNGNIQERERTTTTSIQGVVDNIARERNQITGFNLTGYSGIPTESSTTEGPPLGSCPTNWTASAISGPTIVNQSSILEAGYSGTWVALQ